MNFQSQTKNLSGLPFTFFTSAQHQRCELSVHHAEQVLSAGSLRGAHHDLRLGLHAAAGSGAAGSSLLLPLSSSHSPESPAGAGAQQQQHHRGRAHTCQGGLTHRWIRQMEKSFFGGQADM